MKKFLYAFVIAVFSSITAFAQTATTITYSVSPTTFEETDVVTFTFTVPEATFGTTSSHALYIWGWSTDSTNAQVDCPTNGTWTASNPVNKLTYVGPAATSGYGTYTFTMNTVKSFYGNRTNPLIKIGLLVKSVNGSAKTQDILLPVGKLQLTLTNPLSGSTTIANPGDNINITATASIASTFQLKANGVVVNTTSTASTNYSYNYTVNSDAAMELTATSVPGSATQTKTFTIALTPVVQSAAIPTWIRPGINYDPADPTKVGLALYAPLKSYVHVIGSFNNWTMSANYIMKRDTTNPDLYWIEISGLTPQQVYTFQYRTTSLSNLVVKVADPFSPLVLSPDDDPYISATTYPNLPVYPAGQQYDVSVLQTAKPAYSWTISNFTKPAKENLIIYELLVRDFTVEQNWQSMIDKISYLKSLKINAVELMPIMEFDGNNSWGYNPSFHYALDKAYGTPEKFKEFVDKLHQNGIAVILDIALNHASGRSPLERMWANNTSDGGYGSVAGNNPYFNVTATHAYSVLNDFNHSKTNTQYYVNRVLEQWIKEYKVDGFRWDLTKGFTQNCTANDEACTGSYQADRVAILKQYADYEWSYDPNSFIIFEHLGGDTEEQQWANYRIGEGKGVMMWDIQNGPYGENTQGTGGNSNFNRIDFENHGFTERRADSYGESHDEERLMYKNLNYGAVNGTYNVRNLNTALDRMKAFGAVILPVPGPKMIWQFGELGFDLSINRCEDGTINNGCRTSPKPSAFAPTMQYDQNANRKAVYDTWAKIIGLRLGNEVFNTKTFTVESGNLMPRIYIWNDALPSTGLKNVVILANFTTSTQNIVPNFPYNGNWYNLMDNSSMTVTNTTTPVTLAPGDFRIFGNAAALAADEVKNTPNAVSLKLTENPAVNGVAKIRYANAKGGTIAVYDLGGKLVKTFKVSADKGDETVSINGLQSGIYLLQLKAEKGTAVTKMIVK